MKTLIEVWSDQLETAIELGIIEFIIVYEHEYYISEWAGMSGFSFPTKIKLSGVENNE